MASMPRPTNRKGAPRKYKEACSRPPVATRSASPSIPQPVNHQGAAPREYLRNEPLPPPGTVSNSLRKPKPSPAARSPSAPSRGPLKPPSSIPKRSDASRSGRQGRDKDKRAIEAAMAATWLTESPAAEHDRNESPLKLVGDGSFVDFNKTRASPTPVEGPILEAPMVKWLAGLPELIDKHCTDLSKLPELRMSPLSDRVSAGSLPDLKLHIPGGKGGSGKGTFRNRVFTNMKERRRMLTKAFQYEDEFVGWDVVARNHYRLPPPGSDPVTQVNYLVARQFAIHLGNYIKGEDMIRQYNLWMAWKMGRPGQWPLSMKAGKHRNFPCRVRGAYPNWFERMCNDDALVDNKVKYDPAAYANWDTELEEFLPVWSAWCEEKKRREDEWEELQGRQDNRSVID